MNPSDKFILSQMPGIFVIKEIVGNKSVYRFVNQPFAEAIGFSNPDDAIGLSDCDAKCDAIVDSTEVFYQHDLEVMRGQTLRTLDIYPYVCKQIHGILAIKKPFVDPQGQIQGVLAQGFPLTQTDILRFIARIPDFALIPTRKSQTVAGTYSISSTIKFFDLTKKELECFFYLIRGKSASEIAKILNRSLRTIQTHIEHIKQKCNVTKKSELFELADTYGLLTTIPTSLFSGTEKISL